MLDTTATASAVITDARLEATALHLQSTGDARSLIVLVDTWGEYGLPTPAARLAQVRALLELGLVDKAWSRLQTLDDQGEHRAEVLRLTARMFVQRGWPVRAQTPLRQALRLSPGDSELLTLERQSREPPIQPPESTPDMQRPVHELLAFARSWLASGSSIRAKGLLKAMKRHHGSNREVDELLWAIQGDFVSDEPMADLVQRWGPALGTLAELSDEADQTEARDGLKDSAERAGGFPSLFRGDPGDLPDLTVDPQEVTRSTTLSDLADELGSKGIGSLDEDTQVLFVVRPSEGALFEEPEAPDFTDEQDGVYEEEEDDDRIVHTGTREQEPPTEEVPLEPEPLSDSELPWVDLDGAPKQPTNRIWLLTLVAMSTAGIVFVGLVVLLQILAAWV